MHSVGALVSFLCVGSSMAVAQTPFFSSDFDGSITSRRVGEPKQCQGTVISDWAATDADGNPKGQGTNVVRLSPDGKIAGIVGFW